MLAQVLMQQLTSDPGQLSCTATICMKPTHYPCVCVCALACVRLQEFEARYAKANAAKEALVADLDAAQAKVTQVCACIRMCLSVCVYSSL